MECWVPAGSCAQVPCAHICPWARSGRPAAGVPAKRSRSGPHPACSRCRRRDDMSAHLIDFVHSMDAGGDWYMQASASMEVGHQGRMRRLQCDGCRPGGACEHDRRPSLSQRAGAAPLPPPPAERGHHRGVLPLLHAKSPLHRLPVAPGHGPEGTRPRCMQGNAQVVPPQAAAALRLHGSGLGSQALPTMAGPEQRASTPPCHSAVYTLSGTAPRASTGPGARDSGAGWSGWRLAGDGHVPADGRRSEQCNAPDGALAGAARLR